MKSTFIFGCAVSLLAILGFTFVKNTKEGKQSKKSNVVIILTDDQRWDALSVSGNPYLKTPNIDKLASEGVFFKNYFCTTSLCSPSRASILSGVYAHTHGVVNNFTDFPVDRPNMASVLHSDGYETAYIGKWHMGEENDNPRPGFDYFVTHKGQGKYWNTEFNINGQGSKEIKGYYTNVVTKLAKDWLETKKSNPFFLILGYKAPHSFYT
jgi:arylsulfatase A-like enzyme